MYSPLLPVVLVKSQQMAIRTVNQKTVPKALLLTLRQLNLKENQRRLTKPYLPNLLVNQRIPPRLKKQYLKLKLITRIAQGLLNKFFFPYSGVLILFL